MNVQFSQHREHFDVHNRGLFFINQPFSGVLKRNANEIHGIAICNYADGLKNGVFKEWYVNGQIKEVSLFRADELHGRRICYWPNGLKRFHVNYVDGCMNGIYEEWDETGISKQIKTYYKGKLICVKKSHLRVS